MPRRQRQSTTAPETLGGLAAKGLDVWCWCNGCPHSAVLRTGDLIARLGTGFPIPEIGSRLVCVCCGGRLAEARPDWPSGGVIAWHGPSQSARQGEPTTKQTWARNGRGPEAAPRRKAAGRPTAAVRTHQGSLPAKPWRTRVPSPGGDQSASGPLIAVPGVAPSVLRTRKRSATCSRSESRRVVRSRAATRSPPCRRGGSRRCPGRFGG
jgi:hypothetical protein